MAAKAKEDRDELEVKLICALEELDLTVGGAPKSKRVLELNLMLYIVKKLRLVWDLLKAQNI